MGPLGKESLRAQIEMTPEGELVFHGRSKLSTREWTDDFSIQEFGIGHVLENPMRLTLKYQEQADHIGIPE